MNTEKNLVFLHYLHDAKQCTSPEDAQQLINTVADDIRVSDQHYEIIRRTALKSAYNY